MMDDDKYLTGLNDWIAYWDNMCSKAAAKAGISIEEVKKRLDNGEAVLEISFIAKKEK